MTATLRAELFLAQKSRAILLVGLAWFGMSLVFGLVIPLIVHEAVGSKPTSTVSDPAKLVSGLKPVNMIATTTGLYPIYGAALMAVLGAVLLGGEYRHHTWTGIFVQDARRRHVVAAKLAVAAVATLVITVLDFLVMGTGSYVIAIMIDLPKDPPSVFTVIGGLATAGLTAVMATFLGATVAILTRSVAVAVAIGLVWMLAIENLLSTLSGVAPALGHVRAVFPGGSSGSLMSSFAGDTESLPGVAALEPTALALAIVLAYLVVAALVAIHTVSRRDVV